MDSDVLIDNVVNNSKTFLSRVSFDVDCFKWIGEIDMTESNISNAVDLGIGRHRPDAHSHRVYDVSILNSHILRTAFFQISRFHGNSIIIVLNSDVLDEDVLPRRIDPICVEREHGDLPGRRGQ